jgi:hypothetical protein
VEVMQKLKFALEGFGYLLDGELGGSCSQLDALFHGILNAAVIDYYVESAVP